MKDEFKTKKIGEVINLFYKNYKLIRKNDDSKISDIWRNIVGDYIFSKTDNISISKNIIYIKVNDEIIKKELILKKTEIKNNFSKKFNNLKSIQIN